MCKVFNQVRICAPSMLPKLPPKERERRAVMVKAALVVMTDANRVDGVFARLPGDVLRKILNFALPSLRLRRRRQLLLQ